MPAPKGNINGLKHGRRTKRVLELGALPKGCSHIRQSCGRLRIQVENAVVALHGEITLADSATIQTLVRYEKHAMLATKWLRDNPQLEVLDKLAISRDIAKASQQRDACIRQLGLDKRTDPWAELYSPPRLPAPAPEDNQQAVQPDQAPESAPPQGSAEA